MKTLIIILISVTSTWMTAQNTVTWKGGTPGKETKWEEAKNWSNNQVPNENSYVIIAGSNSGHNAYPVINSQVEVASINVQSGASLTVSSKGQITIDGSANYTEGITSYNGKLINEGSISLQNIELKSKNNLIASMQGDGNATINGKTYHNFQYASIGL